MTQLSNFLPESALWGLSRLISSATVHRMLNIGDTMARRSKEIVSEKKAALASGDDELVQRVGEGKDLMSILRAYHVQLAVFVRLQRLTRT